jgi:hypothetical protein
MHRVLRPGGTLLFAENLAGSALHRFLRQRFVRWSETWRYVELEEIPRLFAEFCYLEIMCRGFFAALGRTESQRSALHLLDVVAMPLVRNASRYVAVGSATK